MAAGRLKVDQPFEERLRADESHVVRIETPQPFKGLAKAATEVCSPVTSLRPSFDLLHRALTRCFASLRHLLSPPGPESPRFPVATHDPD